MDRPLGLLFLLELQLLDSLLQTLDFAIGLRKGGGFQSTTNTALRTPTLTVRAWMLIVTLDAMDTAPVASSGDLASFLLPGPRGRPRAGLGLRSFRIRGDAGGAGGRHGAESCKHDTESEGDSDCGMRAGVRSALLSGRDDGKMMALHRQAGSVDKWGIRSL